MDAAVATAAHRVLTAVPGQQASVQDAVRRVAGRDPAGTAKRRGNHRGTQAAAAMIAARQNDGAFGGRPGSSAPSLASGGPTPADLRLRRGMDRLPQAVPHPQRVDVPHVRAAGADQPRYAQDFNEVKTIGSVNSTIRTADQTRSGDLVARPASDRMGDQAPARHDPAAEHAPDGADVRDGRPGRGRCRDRLLQREGVLELLAASHRDPAGRHRRQPGHGGRPDLDAVARHAAAPRLHLRTYLFHRGEYVGAGVLLRVGTTSRSAGTAPTRARPGTSPAFRRRSPRSSTPASGAASTPAPPTSRARRSVRSGLRYMVKHYFRRLK